MHSIRRSRHNIFVGLVGLAVLFFTHSAGAAVVFSDFSSTAGLVRNASATGNVNNGVDPNPVLRLTSAIPSDSGSAFSQVTLNASNFSTFFQFRITNPGGVADSQGQSGADGIVFVIQPVSSSLGGSGVGIGYEGIPTSVGVEFDTWDNDASNGFPSVADPSTNHIGVDLNGDVHSVQTIDIADRFDNGNLWSVWIDYNGATLEIRANETGSRPVSPTISRALDVPSIIGQSNAFVGFTSGTGGAWGNHYIVDWEYRDAFNPIDTSSAP